MTPVISSSASNISLIPGCSFDARKKHSFARCYNLRKLTKRTFYAQDFIFPLSTSLRLFPHIRTYGLHHKPRYGIVSATGVDVNAAPEQIDQPGSTALDQGSGETLETPSTIDKLNVEPSTNSTQRSRPVRKSQMPPVTNEELVPGATFTGKIRSIQTYGAFVDIGAFKDGLVHVSKLSNSFVKDVESVVSVGQEVKVKVVKVDFEKGKISLAMADSEPANDDDKSRPPRKDGQKSNQKRDEGGKTTKFVMGQELQGTVKNLTRSGSFISLSEGEEGFLPASEEAEQGFGNMMGESSLEVGQEVNVRVLRIIRGRVTLTMKKEEDAEAPSSNLQGVVYKATNPFLVAFRKNQDIAAFLDEKKEVVVTTEIHEESSSVPSVVQDKDDQESQEMVEMKSDGDSDETETSRPPEIEDEKAEPESISSEAQMFASGEETELSSLTANEDKKGEHVPDENSGITSEEQVHLLVEEGETPPPVQDEVPEPTLEETSSTTTSNEQVDIPVIHGSVNKDSDKTGTSFLLRVEAETESVLSEAEVQTSDDEKIEPVPDGSSGITSEVQVQMPVEESETPPPVQGEGPAPEETSILASSNEQVRNPVIQETTIEDSDKVETSSPSPVEDEKVDVETESISSQGQKQTPGEEAEISALVSEENESLKPVSDEISSAKNEGHAQISVEENETPAPVQAVVPEPATEETSSIAHSDEQVDAPVVQETAMEDSDKNGTSSSSPAEDEKVDVETDSISSQAQKETPGEETEISAPVAVENESLEPVSDEISSVTSEDHAQISVEENETHAPFQAGVPEAAAEETSSITDSNEQVDAPLVHEETSSITDSNEQVDVPLVQETAMEETSISEIVEDQHEEPTTKVQMDSEIPSATPVKKEQVGANENGSLGATSRQNDSITGSNGQTITPSPSEATPKATISPALVKQLREETGAGMMDCKKALSATAGDLIKAHEYLRIKGLASADKKASRATAEGRISSYVHDGRIGVLIEVNCETDFVSRGDIFKELVNDLAMQVAACPQVQYLVPEDVPTEIVEKEKAIEMQREDLTSRPEQIRSKIVEGRIKKRLEELALLEQPYIRNDKVVVKDFVKSTIATIGENIKVKRFVRFNLGEGLEKKSQDFAAEVAAQTSAKPVTTPAKEQPPAAAEANEAAKEAPKATISAALVKQLREETGAGMMDCKKALSETGGDLEKAYEYLRKKGLSTADKKSSRLAAEGRIGSYIHDSRVGVLIEVNCETDFVGRSEKFKELVDDLAMQVVACPKVEYVSIEDISESTVSKEKEVEMQREDILSKPENIRGKIVEGRVSKRLGELALLEQPYLRDDSILVKDLVKQTVAAIGENIKVRRFVRFTLGE